MARFRFVPQTRGFFELYSRASANVIEIARLLAELLTAFPEENPQIATQI